MADSVTITSIDESEGAGPSTSTSGALSPATTTLFEAPTAGPPLKTEALACGSKTTSTDLLESSLHSTPSTSQLNSANTSPSPAAEGATEQTAEGGGGVTGEEEKKDDSIFEWNICLDTAKDAVVSMCGHLFCWPCLHQWLETRPRRQSCPVCKAAISKEKVIPLYGRGSTNQQDPRTKVPPRPAGQRTEPEPGGFQGFGLGDSGFHMSFGIGAFPLGYLTSSFNFDGRGRTAERGTAQFEEEQFLSKVFIWVAMIFLAWLVFVY